MAFGGYETKAHVRSMCYWEFTVVRFSWITVVIVTRYFLARHVQLTLICSSREAQCIVKGEDRFQFVSVTDRVRCF
jgi:hypothetical protein